ncbi:MAG: acyltransferase [Nitrospirota bacterium]
MNNIVSRIALRIKRKETPVAAFLYRLAKGIRTFSIPTVKPIHLPLYYLDRGAREGLHWILHTFWWAPLFRARCESAGKNLCVPNEIPYVIGSHLRIILGDNVTIMRTTIGASKIYDAPLLKIGNNSTIGYGTTISVAKEVVIGDNCLIGPSCLIMDSDDHPISPQKRLMGEGVPPEEVKPVRIGNNVWIGSNCVILKGVTIGDNSVIATHSVITKDVMENCVYAGYPARPVLRDIDKGTFSTGVEQAKQAINERPK